MPNMHDLPGTVPCQDASLDPAVCAALLDYAVIVMSPDGIVRSWSEGAETIFRYTASEIVGRPLATVFTPEDQATGQPAAELRTAAARGRSDDERWHMRKGGERIWATGTVRSLRDPDGHLTGFVKLAREVTTKKFAELERDAQIEREQQARAEAERQWSRFEQIFANVPAAIGLIRLPDQVYLFANRTLREWAGDRHLTGRSVAEAHPQIRAEISAALDRTTRTGHPVLAVEQHLPIRPGVELQYYDSSFQLMRAAGWPQDLVLMFLVDVTQRVQARLELERVNAELQAEGERLSVEIRERQSAEDIARTQAATVAEQAALLDLAQDAIFSLRMDGRIIYWNRGAEELYGWSRQEAVGRIVHELLQTRSPIPLEEIRTRLLQEGQWVGELQHHVRSGEVLNVLTTWVLRIQDGKPAGWLEIARDVTEWRRMEEHLRETQKLESLGVLAGGVAHDFNNLLTGIMGNISLAIDRAKSGAEVSLSLANALHASERAAYLTRQMLAYAGKGQFVVESVDLVSALQEAVGLVRGSIPDSVHLEFDFAAELCCIHADPTQLQQVIMNIILNAAEAVGETGGKVQVRLTTRKVDPGETPSRCDVGQLTAGSYGVLVVHDTGPGIDPAIRSKIFDPFFTTKFAGRGLGLASTAGIVRLMNGAICVESEPGRGTTFHVFLPLDRTVDEPGPDPAVKNPILIVDDEEVVRQTASAMLSGRGYEVILAENGRRAVDLFRERGGRFALVLLDLTMPVMGGPETIRELKAIRPEVPVIVSTGLTEETAMRRFAGADIAGFIQKPYTLNMLIDKIHSVLDSH